MRVFWFFMLAMCLMIPIIMIGFGSYFVRKAPREINGVFGYRTRRSMLNRDTWEFAHRHYGRLSRIIGWILLSLSVFAMLLVCDADEDAIGTIGSVVCIVQVLAILLSIIPTEIALKRNFTEDGQRRQES